jgi:hypothetical protein
MNNNKQKPTHSQQLNLKKMPQIQPLNLEELDSVAGGSKLIAHELTHVIQQGGN